MPEPSTTESRNPDSAQLDAMSPLEIVRLMNAQDAEVVRVVESQAEAIAVVIQATAERLAGSGRLFYVGAGTSGRLGVLDAAECPPTFDTDPSLVQAILAGGNAALTHSIEGAEDSVEQGALDLSDRAGELGSCDVVIGISASGTTPFVRGALHCAAEAGAYTAAIVCNADSAIAALVEQAIPLVVGPEILSGSTRLKAGTATKVVLNMISTGVMVRLGRTYGNLMVDVRATNDKLRARARRILVQLTELGEHDAAELLERCGFELKTAILVARRGLAPERARARLADHGGRLRAVLD